MKYVRTKDGKVWTNKNPNHDKDIFTSRYNPKEVVREADTIEELCDRVVVKDSNNKEPRVYNIKKHNWRKIANTLFNIRKVEWVKFAIWTDKGLIYVAKMNDKGCLELL